MSVDARLFIYLSDTSTQMYYFKLIIEESVIENITTRLKPFVNRDLEVNDLKMTTSEILFLFSLKKEKIHILYFLHFFPPSQSVRRCRPAPSAAACQTPDGATQFVRKLMGNVAATQTAPSPTNLLACVFLKKQVFSYNSPVFAYVCVCV